MKINKEGYSIIAVTLCLCLLVAVPLFIFTPLWLAIIVSVVLAAHIVFTLYFFREPSRPVITDPNLIYAPADGKIVVVEPVVEKEFFGNERIQVSVFMSLTNVHINWYPLSGTIEYFKYHPGKYLAAWHPKSSEENERTTVVVKGEKHTVLFRQIAGLIARRIVCYAKHGDMVGQNTKCGFIKFGSRVDIFLPSGTEVFVKPGEIVMGSQTPIARLP